MALIFMESFTFGVMPPPGLIDGSPGCGWVTPPSPSDMSTTGGRFGSGYYQANLTVYAQVPSLPKVTVGWAFRPDNAGAHGHLISLRGDGATQTQHIGLYHTATALELRLGPTTVVATWPLDITKWPQDGTTWVFLEFQGTIADSGGICKVRLNGTTILNFTGDTKNAGTGTTIDRIAFSANPAGDWRNSDLHILDHVDDTAVTGRPDNDFIGDTRVAVLVANGDGDTNQFVGSDGNSVSNYLLVDELGFISTTDYVQSSTVGQKDLYAFSDLPSGATTVYGVKEIVGLFKDDTGARTARLLMKEGGTEVESSDMPVNASATAEVKAWLRKVKPSGGAWTPSSVNSLQAGVKVQA